MLALVLAQAMAQLHAYQHVGDRTGSTAPAGQHGQYCPDCLSHAPLLVMAGCMGAALLFASLVAAVLFSTVVPTNPGRRPLRAFAARAPPLAS